MFYPNTIKQTEITYFIAKFANEAQMVKTVAKFIYFRIMFFLITYINLD